jgi:hypothetical protein
MTFDKIHETDVISEASMADAGALSTVADFKRNCDAGGYTDYDGFGYVVTGDLIDSDAIVIPSQRNRIAATATHILWINR